MLTIHHLIVGRSVFTVWLLEELGIEYQLEPYHRLATRRAPPELREVHPLGKSPVIVDEGRTIAESGAIATYLLEKYDPDHELSPPPSDRDRWVQFIQWLHYPEGSAFGPLSLVLLSASSPEPMPQLVQDFATAEVKLHLDYIESALKERDYILGNEFSAADIGLGYIVALADRLQLIEGRETISAYLQRLQQRPAFQRAHERSGG
ncbi:MAG: glutathione S-transferase family protein [Acidobacteriota bacterium]